MVYNVSLNIGFHGKTLNSYPVIFKTRSIRGISNTIRGELPQFAEFAFKTYSPISQIYLYVVISYGKKSEFFKYFSIKCKNIREYKKYLNKNFEELEELITIESRERKLNDLLK